MKYSIVKYRLLLFFTIFFAPNVIDYFGLVSNTYYTILIAISMMFALNNKNCINRELVYVIIFTILYGGFKIYTDTGEGTRVIVMCAMAPAILFAAYPRLSASDGRSLRLWKTLFTMLLVFYFVEVGIAIYERLTWHLVFGWAAKQSIGADVAMTQFRSTALLGHPLANALVVSILMSFFLVSPIKPSYKYVCWFMGLVAVLCFNARGATIGNVVIFFIYFLYTQFYEQRISLGSKIRLTILVALLVGIACYFVSNGYIGGRLIEDDLDDGSAQVRIDIWNVFTKYDLNTFLIGISNRDLDMIMFQLGLYATENYWLDWLFRLGVLFLLPYVILYAKAIRKEYDGYRKVDMIITIIVFLGISSTNNSLSTSIIPTFIYLFCIRAFSKRTFGYIAPRRMVDVKYLKA